MFVKAALRRPNAGNHHYQHILSSCYSQNILVALLSSQHPPTTTTTAATRTLLVSKRHFHESAIRFFPRKNSPHRPQRLRTQNDNTNHGSVNLGAGESSIQEGNYKSTSEKPRAIFDPLRNEATIDGEVSSTNSVPGNQFSLNGQNSSNNSSSSTCPNNTNNSNSSDNSKVDNDNNNKTFESVIKNGFRPLHESGHCSLEDRNGADRTKSTSSEEHSSSANQADISSSTSTSTVEPENLTKSNVTTKPTNTEPSSESTTSTNTEQTSIKPEEEPKQQPSENSPNPKYPVTGIKGLPSEKESKTSNTRKLINSKLDQLQRYIFTAGQTLNEFTGYSSIEHLKKSIESQEKLLKECREDVRKRKEAYANAINNRSDSQREVNELLQRKHAWNPVDLERFTELYRNDHANQHAEAEAERMLSEAERFSEESQAKLSTLISARYHEEQIWSDKIRRASTWGTWGLMGINICLFVVVQLVIEPRKRARMARSFEDVMKKTIEDEKEQRSQDIEAATSKFEAIAEAHKDGKNTTLGSAVASAVSHNVEEQLTANNHEGSMATVFTLADRKKIDRIEELTENEYQVLQKLTNMLPGITETAEKPSSPKPKSLSTSEDQQLSISTNTDTLTWRNLPQRVIGENSHIDIPSFQELPTVSIDPPETLIVKPIEMVGTAGAGAAFGVLFGVLLTLAFRN